ncbi:hypothetical protein Dimus_036923 [Dionaea muscipula]
MSPSSETRRRGEAGGARPPPEKPSQAADRRASPSGRNTQKSKQRSEPVQFTLLSFSKGFLFSFVLWLNEHQEASGEADFLCFQVVKNIVFHTFKLVKDESDEMLSRGFKDQIYDVYRYLPPELQDSVVVISSTLPNDILEMTRKFMTDPIRILVKRDELTLEGIKQFFVAVEKDEWKFDTMCDLYDTLMITQAVIFCNTKHRVTISNAITNLYATVFGNNLRLEPLKPEKKLMSKREMGCLLSVCDFIVELEDNLLDNGPELEDILESFQGTEFFYMEQAGNRSLYSSSSFRNKVVQWQDEKWWLPVPCIPSGGLSDKCRNHLKHQRDCANQIHKAAMAINNQILYEMKVPESYMAGLPKV